VVEGLLVVVDEDELFALDGFTVEDAGTF